MSFESEALEPTDRSSCHAASRRGSARLDRRKRIIASASLVTLALSVAALGFGGQAPLERGAAAKLTPYVFGPRYCSSCHDQGTLENRPSFTEQERRALICRMNEFPIFQNSDKHQFAYAALTGPRGREMSRLFGTDVLKIEACLNCHSADGHGIQPQQYSAQTDGVTCVSCHGAFADWALKHQQTNNPEWRDLSRKDKEDRYGMTDLWNPVRRAEVCASCHIGSQGEGKVITHAMYAAGHPPLPSFEAATFSEAQPRHWEYLRDKEKTPERWARLKPKPDLRNLEQTQLVVVGGLVSLRESMKLFAAEAATNKSEPAIARWPDFARFDCYACHHELQAKDGASWRQVHRRPGAPGRPMTAEWPSILIQLGIEAAGPERAEAQSKRLDQDLTDFHQSLEAQPFGTPDRIARARGVAASADSLLAMLTIDNQTTFDEKLARKLLKRLCEIATATIPDYDSARQMAWAFRIIYHELTPEGKRDAVIEQALADLDGRLFLNLAPQKKPAEIEKELPDRLKAAAEFDPDYFRSRFEMISGKM